MKKIIYILLFISLFCSCERKDAEHHYAFATFKLDMSDFKDELKFETVISGDLSITDMTDMDKNNILNYSFKGDSLRVRLVKHSYQVAFEGIIECTDLKTKETVNVRMRAVDTFKEPLYKDSDIILSLVKYDK